MEDYGAIDTASSQTSGPKLGKQLRRIMTGRPRAFYSPPGQPPIPVPAVRCAKPFNGLTDCTDLCRKFPNAGHTTTCCKCYPAC